jgi:hypothetical protein
MPKKPDHVQALRDSIAEMLEDFVPATDARRALDDLDELVAMVREAKEK